MFKGRFFVCADIHGSADIVRYIISQVDNPTEEDTIIICGDAGFEYEDYVMGAAKRAARKFPGVWIVLRGNHDSCYWKEHYCTEGWKTIEGMGGDDFLFQEKYPNILYVRDDGGIYKIGKYNFLMLPGAYSVDKWYRLRNGFPWNEDEQLNDAQKDDLYFLVDQWNLNNFEIDYVIAHTFPRFLECYYNHLFLSSIDQATVDKSTEMWLSSMADLFEKNPSFKRYYGGHYHDTILNMGQHYTMVYHNPLELEG